MKYVLLVVALAIGAAGVVLGEADDSPGLQFLGAVVVVTAVVAALRVTRGSR